MGRDKRSKGQDTRRMGGGFIALPWQVVDSPAYMNLSFPAKALLIELDRQYVRDNNGRLLASRSYLGKRGWKSQDVITRALRELVAAKLIHLTVQGHRPNKASWYAVTWRDLDRISGYDAGAAESFVRGGFKQLGIENTTVRPLGGPDLSKIVPSSGLGMKHVVPCGGAVNKHLRDASAPSGGHHLEQPSVVTKSNKSLNGEPLPKYQSVTEPEEVPLAITRKAVKHLAKLSRGEHDEKVIRSGRAAGLTVEQLIDWSDFDTVSRSLAQGVLPWRELWTVTT